MFQKSEFESLLSLSKNARGISVFQTVAQIFCLFEDKNASCINRVLPRLSAPKFFPDLYVPKEVPVLNEIPRPLEFYRDWVAPNIPCKIKGGIKSWLACKRWNKSYFCNNYGEKEISVAVTPNGYADAITETVINDEVVRCFALAEERIIKFSEFLNKLDGGQNCTDLEVKESKGIFYMQKQNSNLTEELPELLSDIEHLGWASEAFNSKPVAINLWIGDERSVSSLHKDPFENLYCVVTGSKDFILIPPTDRPWLPYKRFPSGKYKEISPGKFKIFLQKTNNCLSSSIDDQLEFDKSKSENHTDGIPWIDIDPLNPDIIKYPTYKNVTPLHIRVEAGDILYLPSLWFHHVSQSHGCVAVNFWYDMNFDIKYAYFQFLEMITEHNIRID